MRHLAASRQLLQGVLPHTYGIYPLTDAQGFGKDKNRIL